MLQGQQYLGSVKGGLFEWYLKKRPLCFVGFAAISSVANRSGCYVYSMTLHAIVATYRTDLWNDVAYTAWPSLLHLQQTHRT